MCVVAMNRMMETMTGYSIEQVRGIHGELLVRSNVGNTRGQKYLAVLDDGNRRSLEGDVLDANRRKRKVQYHISRLRSDVSREQGLLIILSENQAMGQNEQFGSGASFEDLIGHSPKMQKVFDMVRHMGNTDASILITGETGTGKDKVAELIHKNSPRAKFPFIKINCGALPEGLLESELFGHVKGAFTGASRNKSGMFALADKGTLFLTEIGDMPLPLQVKLLSVLDDLRFIPVGGEQSVEVDVRVIAATHRSLRDQVRREKFREDLFYRLNVLHLHLPPLRERGGDVELLLDHFVGQNSGNLGCTIQGFDQQALEILKHYGYPGNVREMINIVQYGVHMCKGTMISKEHLPPYIFEKQNRDEEPELSTDVRHASNHTAEVPGTETITSPASDDTIPEKRWDDIERGMIIDALKECGGNRGRVMAKLGWNRMKLWRKMKKYKLL